MAANVCEQTDSYLCELTLRWTGNDTTAEVVGFVVGWPLAIGLLIMAGLIIRWLAHRGIDRFLRKITTLSSSDPAGVTRRSLRAQTIGSLLKSTISAVVVAVVVTMALARLGFNIGPLIASAGIIGLALGFGAQSLVKDYLAGIFLIFEDQYGIGDYVDVGSASGTVENIGLRVTQLRGLDGTAWYIRNGEVVRVGNFSQQWAQVVLDVPLPYHVEVTQARRVLHEVCQQFSQLPAMRGKLIDSPRIWGVEAVGGYSLVVRVSVKTLPSAKDTAARELRTRIKTRFDAEGWVIPTAF